MSSQAGRQRSRASRPNGPTTQSERAQRLPATPPESLPHANKGTDLKILRAPHFGELRLDLTLCRLGILAAQRQGLTDQPGILADGRFDGVRYVLVVLEIGLGSLAALPDSGAVVGEPGA